MKSVLLIFCLLISFQILAQRPGDLDSSFGTNGVVVFQPISATAGMVLQPDDKIVVGGNIFYGYCGLLKFDVNGHPDSSFGLDGMSLAQLRNPIICLSGIPGGDIAMAGSSRDLYKPLFSVRFHSEGGLDTSYCHIGYQSASFFQFVDECSTVALQPDDQMIMSAYLDMGGGVMRYKKNGEIDSGFGAIGTMMAANDLLVQPDGKIIVAGSYIGTRMMRINADGSIDHTFGNTVVDLDGLGFPCLALLADGSILVSGAKLVNGVMDFVVMKFHNNGSIDSTFGVNGTAGIGAENNVANQVASMAVASDGKIVLAGYSAFAANKMVIARFTASGMPDSSFGLNGMAINTILGYDDRIIKIAIQQDGKIVAAGTSKDGAGNEHVTLARYIASASLSLKSPERRKCIIYPNPCSGPFKIEVYQNAVLRIYNTMGQIKYLNYLTPGNNNVAAFFSPGLYLVEVTYQDGTKWTEKLLLEH